ncbi:zinc finger, CCHC-type containing protein [Tanacetum coccineum]
MKHGFLSQKGSGGGRGVKEKSLNRNSMNTSLGIGVFTKSDDTMNEDTPIGVASAVKEDVTQSVVGMMAEKEKISSLEDTTVPESFPPLTTLVTTMAGNAPGKSSYANITGKPSGKKVNVLTLFTPGGNGIDVVILVDSIRAISERFANIAYGFFLGKKVAYHVVANYVKNTWGLDAMLENGPWFIQNNPLILKKLHLNENLLKEDVSTVPVWVKLHGVPVTAFSEDGLSAIATKLGTHLMFDTYTYDMCMQSWGRSSYARVMIKLRADVELKDNIIVAMPKITREGHYTCNVRVEYEWKPPMCSSCKVFGLIHEECPKNIGAGKKKTVKKPSQTSRGVPVGPKIGFKPQKEYRHVPKKSTASSSGNKKKGVEPNIEFEDLLTSRQAILMDKDGNPLKKVEFLGEYDSEDEVALVNNDMAHSMAFERVGFGTQSLLEQWRDSYGNGDYDDDPYDDDMYEGQDLSHELQAIYDNLDIRV